MSENLMNSANSQNDEIDIFELLGKIYKGKFIVLGVTLACFLLGVLYCLIATPWYSAKARISVPYYKNLEENKKELLVEADMIINKIQSKYIDALKGQPKESAFVKKVTPAGQSGTKNNLNDFFDIEVFGKSNDEAIALINKIVKEEQNIYKNEIGLQRKNLQNEISIAKDNIANLTNQVKQYDTILIPDKDKEIENLKNVVIAKLQEDYKNLVEVVIPNLENDIKNIEDEIKSGATGGNLLINLKEQLVDLREQYTTTTTTTKRQIESDLHDIEFVKIAEAQRQKEELVSESSDLNSIITETRNKMEILNGALSPLHLSNVEIKDDFIVINENPAKPKKLLIVAIATFLGGVLGIFWVLLKGEISARKNLKA
ncbi:MULTISPECIES: Wzz/FepE/Etk N-terminal domain-containing protein [unclassified Campylobacter]|uniref:Wzz/FepE/Etk N-terminal domain-containing protein n=1 Tax=unclassified Campylobacter TaxID=2593542 RepID=UPI0022E9FE02|nr:MULTISPECIES: Wzz/FepE/Etk N-terminal domain-containing protein [unclassified Campylobacter]MDA3062013.1 Wzz/FepE/Etk N-terminal domain-containing protein [Campylobacter sp. JMF_14 EL1]MDA3072882.1 Wzz/FepE/Etk N-terminal domain-containing protein [Campylobacter sp. JMF_10 EL2]